jgi:hypothetical protein
MGLGDFIGNNAYTVNAAEAEQSAREKYPLLFHKDERVVLAFVGRGGQGRDKTYFTSHRILFKDGKGIGHKRRNYLTIPYNTIQAFWIQTAGKMDGDSELRLWTTGKMYAGIDFAAKQVDLFAVQQFLNSKISWNWNNNGTTQQQQTESNDAPTPLLDTNQTASMGMVSQLVDWIGDNATQVSVASVEHQLKVVTPILLPDEKVEMAYQSGINGRDLTVFTTKRLLSVDAQGIFGQKIAFLSVQWSAIRAFSVETAGAYFDRDTIMVIYTNIIGLNYIHQDFRKTRADIFAIQRFLCNKILGDDSQPLPIMDRKQGHVDPKTSWWFRDAQRPLDAAEMERYYKNEIPILQGNETVEYAFKGRRDITLLTTKRLIDIDPKGWLGVKIEYKSVPWSNVLAFGVKTAGKHFDQDCEIRLWTDMYFKPGAGEDPPEPRMSFLELDFNKSLVDVIVLKKYLGQRLLGKSPNLPISIPMSSIMVSQEEKGFEKFLSRIGNDRRAIDHTELNRELHTNLPILLDDENVVMAFKAGRDVTLFTSLRIMAIDVQGLSGQKIAYDSIPYSSIRGFAAESAGGWDRDSQIKVYTKNRWNFGKESFDFRKGKADIIAIQKFLAAMVMGSPDDAARFYDSRSLVQTSDPQTFKHFMVWLGSNSEEADPNEFDAQLHSEPPILLNDERVGRAFKQGRDVYLYTTHRILIVDVQGLLGKKVSYKSFPLQWCKGFAVETAGNLDWDAEVYLHLDIPHVMTVMQSILVKSFDIMEMHKYWTDYMLFSEETK